MATILNTKLIVFRHLRCWRMSVTLFDDVVPPGVINLRMGSPGELSLMKSARILKEAAQKTLSQPNAKDLLTYGAELGSINYRKALAKFLSDQYKTPVLVDDLMLTAGATHGLSLLSSVFFSSSNIVFMERLTYFLAIKILKNAFRFNLQTVAMDSAGIDPDVLEEAIKHHLESFEQWKLTKPRPFWAMVYLIPNFHNPTGFCLSSENGQKIVQLARKYNLLIACDDVYDLLYFPDSYPSAQPPRRLFTYDKLSDPDYEGHVVSLGTFSKLFGPGVRVGWFEAPKRVIEHILNSFLPKSGGAFNHMTSGLMTTIMQEGSLDALVQETRVLNQERCRAMSDILRSAAPSVQFEDPKGGYFLWLKLPDGFPISGKEFSERCLNECQVGLFPGEIYSPAPIEEDGQHLRVSFAYYEVEELVTATKRVANFINKLMETQ